MNNEYLAAKCYDKSLELSKQINSFDPDTFKNILQYRFNCKNLEDPKYHLIIDNYDFHPAFYNQFIKVNGSVLYWFNIENNSISADEIIKKFKAYADIKDRRSIPALKKHIPDINSKVLYVGKRNKGFKGRFYQHLGYYDKGSTQGLQLFYWAKELDLELSLNVMQLPKDFPEALTGIYEVLLAKELKPLIGKHK